MTGLGNKHLTRARRVGTHAMVCCDWSGGKSPVCQSICHVTVSLAAFASRDEDLFYFIFFILYLVVRSCANYHDIHLTLLLNPT